MIDLLGFFFSTIFIVVLFLFFISELYEAGKRDGRRKGFGAGKRFGIRKGLEVRRRHRY